MKELYAAKHNAEKILGYTPPSQKETEWQQRHPQGH
jgi:hypothetical protein